MDKKTATKIAVKGLGRNEPRDEILRRICADGTMAWPNAEDLLDEAERNHSGAITFRRMSSLLIFVGFLGIVIGLYLIAINGQLLIDMWNVTPPLYNQLEGTKLPIGHLYVGNNTNQLYAGIVLIGASVLGIIATLLAKL